MAAKFFASTTPHRSAASGLLFCLAAGFLWVAFVVFAHNGQYELMAAAIVFALATIAVAFAVRGGTRRSTSRWDRENISPPRKSIPAVIALAVCILLVIVWWNV